MFRIHIHTLDTCEVNTKLPITELDLPSAPNISCSLALFSEYLVFCSLSDIATLRIWSWYSGKLLLVSIVTSYFLPQLYTKLVPTGD